MSDLLEVGPRVEFITRAPRPWPQQVSSLDPMPESSVRGTALVDTGATMCLLDHVIVDQLRLPAVSSVLVRAFSGGARYQPDRTFSARSVMAQLSVGGGVVEVPCAAVNLTGVGVQAVLGRDFLKHFILSYNGPAGTFTLQHVKRR